ncbi:XRE family transcriptional regulator [Micromonospora zingiberis]|uniref:XRE family transcriptional regulator n=1 Tax=Micromonospora zingiberis TaxID=2053011 RepID=A0A4R0GNQ6_9ACTN|nr:helix-turn-helix transcriptional regulator [Micromonospora zingiberis]TCB97201.1 XRE family transcriptional regulator [Micromonospora zingiberis]
MSDHDDLTAARRALGRRLAHLRKAAGHTQHGLARLVQYGRSSVANTETGRQHPERSFWARCDTVLGTGAVLTAEYDRIADLDHRRRHAVRPAHTSPPLAGGETLWENEDRINARRLVLTTMGDDAQLTDLEHHLQKAIADQGRCPAASLLARLRPLRVSVDQLMAARQHPPQRARLYTAAAHLSGLLAALALDQRAYRIAHAYAAEAFDLAHSAQQPDTQAWARTIQSLVALYSGDLPDALSYAEDGLRRADTGPLIRFTVNGQGQTHGLDHRPSGGANVAPTKDAQPDGRAETDLGSYRPAQDPATAPSRPPT